MPKKKSSVVDTDQLFAAAEAGLAGVAREGEVGNFLAPEEADGVWLVRAPSLQAGYPGWMWTVCVTPSEEGAFTVTEVHLLPGDAALLSPEWVPWSERLEEYRRVEAEREAHEADADIDDEVDDDDGDDLDDVLDGIDIDELDIDMDPAPLEIPEPPSDVFDHVEFDDDEV